MGAMILRKALLWGYGLEEDRDRFGVRGKRDWVDRVERFVSLAGINRGWSIEPRPREMSLGKYIGIWVGEKFARLTGTGQLILDMQRGAPFIADARVQWIRLARSAAVLEGQRKLPIVLQLLGDRDDIVAREDSVDLAAGAFLDEVGGHELPALPQPAGTHQLANAQQVGRRQSQLGGAVGHTVLPGGPFGALDAQRFEQLGLRKCGQRHLDPARQRLSHQV